MGNSDIIKTTLEAYQIAQETGERKITSQEPNNWLPDWLKNIGKAIWDVGGQLIGFVCGALGSAFSFTFSKAWSVFVSSVQFLWTLNWDMSDQQLDGMYKNFLTNISAQVGSTLGNLAGYLVCGMAPGLVMMKFNKALAVKILKEVGEETLEEFGGNLAALCQSAFNGLAQMAIITLFKNGRRFAKEFLNNPNSPQNKIMTNIFGDKFNKFIAGWGDGKEDYSFSNQWEEFLERIPNEQLRQLTEEFFEEAAEACIEAGYIVAGGLDEYAIQQRAQREQILGEQKIVEITPNREASHEKLILAGNEAIVKATLPVVLSTHQQIDNRDVGQWVGEPLRENLRRSPRRLELKILLFSQQFPPFYPSGKKTTRVQITLPGVERSALSWSRIKLAVGGTNGYFWGRFKTITKLIDNLGNFGGLLTVYGATADESKDITNNLLQLTDYSVATMDTTEELKVGRRAAGRAMAKETTRVYPGYVVITNAQKVINEEEGRATLSGAYKSKRDRLELYGTAPPPDWDEVIRELLLAPGANL